ncbi:MAG TPA: GAF domain-containing protein, partial [Polyangiaceae bacterium]|nr:GAF domain-containing protein [Polyangiaceae bacterium]
MPILKWFPPEGTPHAFSLYKPVSTIGRALGNDVAIKGDKVADTHAQVLFDGRDFNLEEVDKQAEILINGKKKRRARLVHGDRLTLGDAELSFSMFDEPRAQRPSDIRTPTTATPALSETQLWSAGQSIAGLRKLYEFSETLMTRKSVDEVLEAMLDAVIDVTGAEKGLILLLDDTSSQPSAPPSEDPKSNGESSPRSSDTPKLRVRAARNVHREAVSEKAISDSIVQRVLATGRPVIVSDALTDTEFSASESVLALQLSSVMCAPLVASGHTSGVLYVGNDRVKGLFLRSQLDVMTVFAGQASLILQNALLLSTLRADKEKLAAELKDKRFGEIIGVCPSMQEVFRKLAKVATTDIS